MQSKQIEFRRVDKWTYRRYYEKAYKLLTEIAKYYNQNIINVGYLDIISFFEDKFKVGFIFFEEFAGDYNLPDIKYGHLVKRKTSRYMDNNLVENVRGATLPVKERILIYLNQSHCTQERIIFTIIHELCHLYFHVKSNDKIVKKNFVTSVSKQFEGVYTTEGIPFEDEANIITSILLCNTEKIEILMTKNWSFGRICSKLQMSPSAVHNRLFNYSFHILKLSTDASLDWILKFRDGDWKAAYNIRGLITNKNIQKKLVSIKMSSGLLLDEHTCANALHNMSLTTLISELDYARNTKNNKLEQLVMNEYYQKHQLI